MINSPVKIRTNLFIIFLITKFNGISMWRFHSGDYDEIKNGNLFQKKRCFLGFTLNVLLLCLFMQQTYIGVDRCINLEFSIANLLVVLLFSITVLLLINTQVSHQSTISCVNEAYRLTKLCKIEDPLPSRLMFLIGLPVYCHILRIALIPEFDRPDLIGLFIISTIQICIITTVSMFIILVLRICEKHCDQVISDLIALKNISPNACFFKLRRVLVSYMRLADFIERITPAFGCKILCLVLEYFFDCYISVFYTFTYKDMRIFEFSLVYDILPLLMAQYRMILMCSISSSMQRKASKIEKHVEDLLIRAVLKDQYLLRAKLEAFKLEIQTRKYTITPYGLFTLDMDLYTSILTILASNCAMILQLFNDEIKNHRIIPGKTTV